MGQFEAFVGVNFWTALFILLNTLVIFFVAKKFLFGPVMHIIETRQQEIDDMYTQAGTAKEEAVKLQAEYEDKLSQAAATSEPNTTPEVTDRARAEKRRSSARQTSGLRPSVPRHLPILPRRRRRPSTMPRMRFP